VPRHFTLIETALIGKGDQSVRCGEQNNFFPLLGIEKGLLGLSFHSIVTIVTELTPASVWGLYVFLNLSS
jgi:hypothetical protein